MPKILVLVHGMGVAEPGWAGSIVTQLNAATKRYKPFKNGPDVFLLARDADDETVRPTPDQVLVVPAGYDAEIRARARAFQNDTQAILNAAGTAGIALPGEIVDVLRFFRNAGETEKNFFWSHVVDVLLYRFFPLVTKQIRVVVMESVAKCLARTDADVSVMAHSLGTAVTHDALSTLARGMVPELRPLMPPGVRLRHLFMVANVSRILEKPLAGDMDVYQSFVSPVSVDAQNGYCGQMFNFRHMLDPFPLPRRFEPQWSGSDFIAVDRLLHVADFNVHGWEHYVDNPEVHIPMLNALMGFEVIDDATAHAAIENYKVAPVPLCKAGMDLWVAESRRLAKSLETNPSIAELLRSGAQFYATVQAARALCGMTLTASPAIGGPIPSPAGAGGAE